MEKWYTLDEKYPEPGDLCVIKMEVTSSAFYTPDSHMSDWIYVEDEGDIKPRVVSWQKHPTKKNIHKK